MQLPTYCTLPETQTDQALCFINRYFAFLNFNFGGAIDFGGTRKASFLGALAKLRKAIISFVMSVCLSICPSAWNNWAPTRRIFLKFDNFIFF